MSGPAGRQLAGALIVCGTAALCLSAGGCTTLSEWVHNGFKVGPNFHEPPAPVAPVWIDAADPPAACAPAADGAWWAVFQDPVLDSLVDTAYRQNLDLRTAAARVLESQAQRNIAAGNLFPQTQNAVGDYLHAQIGTNLNIFNNPQASLPTHVNVWATGFNASWELDFWGRLRRNVESAAAERDAAVESYHDALVTLVADAAAAYIQLRTFQQRIAYARRNVEIQRGTLGLAEARVREGRGTALDVTQARASLAQTESSIPPLVVGLRQANDRLCVLLGLPPEDLVARLGEPDAPIPHTPPAAAVGVPAELLQRRPDVRRALRAAAAQSARVGVAEADFYPSFGVTGFLGYTAGDIRRLFAEDSFTGLVLPSFQWKVLNYGRILNNVRAQDARLRERVLQYQQTVLAAGREVEDALVAFVQYQLQARSLAESVAQSQRTVELVRVQYREGLVDFNRVFTTQLQLVAQQDQLAAARGNIALGLVAVYRALGGGWRFFEDHPQPAGAPGQMSARDNGNVPLPAPAGRRDAGEDLPPPAVAK